MTVDIWPKPSPEPTHRLKGRRRAQRRARRGGFFWIPCPLCGQMFGGHEGSHPSLTIPDPVDPMVGWMVCPAHDPIYPDGFNAPKSEPVT